MNTNTRAREARVTTVRESTQYEMIGLLRGLVLGWRIVWKVRAILAKHPQALACYLAATQRHDWHVNPIRSFERAYIGSYDSRAKAGQAVIGDFTWSTLMRRRSARVGVELVDSYPPATEMAWGYLVFAFMVIECDGTYHVFLPNTDTR